MQQVLGSWKLISYVSRRGDGAVIDSLGPLPKGMAMFNADGSFSITVMRADLPAFASGNRQTGTPAENEAVVRGSIAYFGTYAALNDGSGLSIDIAGSTLPNWTGTRQIRKVSMPAADRLVLTNPVASGGGVAEVAWERL